jgi:hypothetical protein
MRRQAAEHFVKTARSGDAVSVRGIARDIYSKQPTVDSTGRSSGKPGTAEGTRLIQPPDGYSTRDNAGLDPGFIPLPRTPDEANTARMVGKRREHPYRFLQEKRGSCGMPHGVVTSRSRKRAVSSKTRKGGNYKRHWSQVRTKTASRFAADFDQYHTTAGGEAMSARAPFHSIGGTQVGLAAGGVVKGPVHALLGEKGPEVVVPLKKRFMNKKVKDVAQHFVKREAQRGRR